MRQILPKDVADIICPKGSRLAQLYGLPKTHKPALAIRPILSVSGTYNFKLAKWLDEKLKPISINEFTISDPLRFSEELRKNRNVEILVSYDVSSLFTNVPVDETIEILVQKAFHEEWFNNKYKLALKECDLRALLSIAVKNQLFQLDGKLYEQIDGVAMGSPLGPLMANTFMCSIEEKLVSNMVMPSFYHRFVDDTITPQRNLATAEDFLDTLNNCHESLNFTMECEVGGKLPFLGMEAIRNKEQLETKVHVKPTNTGLLLHCQSHVDRRYKRSLITTMLNRAFRLSSSWKHFVEECDRLKTVFVHLQYPRSLVDSIISRFVQKRYEEVKESTNQQECVVSLILPFKDQKSADIVRRQLTGLGSLIGKVLRPVFTSRKIRDEVKVKEVKAPLVNNQCVVYKFKCDLCDADYVGYTCRHLHQRIDEHKGSVVGLHMREHQGESTSRIENCFSILGRCRGNYECLLYEMLYIRELKPSLNTQSDSINSNLFN